MTGQTRISGLWLKLVAVVSMLIDHTAAALICWYPSLDGIYLPMRLIGRLAFPIYCFLLVEGFFHTRSRAKYAGRLFAFALISEVPFDMAFRLRFWDSSYNNVFFTLLFGLLLIWAAAFVKQRLGGVSPALVLFLWLCLLFAFCLLANALHTDYHANGILAIFALYVFYENRMLGMAAAIAVLGVLGDASEFAALPVLPLLFFYDGTRGKQLKYFFYAFYPAHLLLLALLASALGVGMEIL